jgi:hypothetical protein
MQKLKHLFEQNAALNMIRSAPPTLKIAPSCIFTELFDVTITVTHGSQKDTPIFNAHQCKK